MNEIYYDLRGSNIVEKVLTDKDVKALESMFEHPGWGVFMSIRSGVRDAAVSVGMDNAITDAERNDARALYKQCTSDLNFQKEFARLIESTAAVSFEEITEE